MAAIFRPLQFNHKEAPIFVKAKEINSSAAAFPAAEFLGKDHGVGRDGSDFFSEQLL